MHASGDRTTKVGRDLVAAAITSAVAVAYCLSYGALIFAGPLAANVSTGISMMLVTTAVSGIVVALTSSFRFAVAGPDSNATPVLAAIAATIVETFPHDPARAVHDVVFALMLGALLGGAFLLVIGQYRLGRWIRFIPYPIVAGFLAATGWLLLNGALRVVADLSFPLHLSGAFTPSGAARLAVGIAFATIVYRTRRMTNPLILPGLLIGTSSLTVVIVKLTESVDQARTQGWFMMADATPSFTSIASPLAFAGITWPLIGDVAPAIATAIAVTAIAILFNAAGLEAQTGDDSDLDRELRSSGIASIASALCGGTLGTLSSSRTLLHRAAGAQTRVAGVIAGVLLVAVLFGGLRFIELVPRPILGGLLISMGFSLLREWLGTAFRRLSKLDGVLVAAIVIVTGLTSFITALGAALLFSCVSFAVRYGRFRAVRHVLSAREKRSRVERSQLQRAALETYGERIRILVLHGYVFFGTANAVLDEARRYLGDGEEQHLRYMILDFAAVTGLDSSAANSFATLMKLAQRNGIDVLCSSLSPSARAVLKRAGVITMTDRPSAFSDLDHALEWCENAVLDSLAVEHTESVEEWLARELGGIDRARAFLRFFDRVQVDAETALFHRGEASDSLYIVESGRLRVSISDDPDRRLRSMVAGSIIGEMGLYANEPRSADVIAERDATLLRLSSESLERLNHDDPAIAAAFHAMLFRLQAERLRFASAEIAALQG